MPLYIGMSIPYLFILSIGLYSIDVRAEKTVENVVNHVKSGMKAGLIDGNREAYAELFAQDAVFIQSRTSRADAHSTVVSAHALMKHLKRSGMKPGNTLSFDVTDARVTFENDTATLTWTANLVSNKHFMRLMGERYRLTRQDHRWVITENQYWTLAEGFLNETYQTDAEYWRIKDQAVESARRTQHFPTLMKALFDARRYTEFISTFESRPPENRTSETWMYAAWAYGQLARTEDALASTCASLRAGESKDRLVPNFVASCAQRTRSAPPPAP